MEHFSIWRKTEEELADLEDDNSWKVSRTSLLLVLDEDEDEFAEYQAEDYGNQDYTYKVEFTKLGTFRKEEGLKLIKMLEEVKKQHFLDEV